MPQQRLDQAIKQRGDKDFAGAGALLGELLALYPNNPDVHYQLAWTYDAQGKEPEAVPHYEAALANGLIEGREGAYLGLGSTYRCLGQYQKSAEVFDRAIKEFPDNRALKVFHALTLYNLGQPDKSVERLLTQLLETTSDPAIKSYSRALAFYADKLDQTWPAPQPQKRSVIKRIFGRK